MINESRVKRSISNLLTAFINKCIIIVFPFINRTIIILYLGKEYLGLGSLFKSVLSVLNLSELGFSIAITYSMYSLIAHDNSDKICALLNYYKIVYRNIGIVVLSLGLILLPFIPYLIKGEYPKTINIYILFVLYLIQSVSSYFLLGYRSVILSAHQRMDIINTIQMITTIGQNILQFAILVLTRNYYLYTVIFPIFTVLNNIIVSLVAKKEYPNYYCNGSITQGERRNIISRIKGLAIDRISVAIRNSSDNIVISALFGLIILAKYSNYYYIMYNVIYCTLLFLTQSIQASIGDSIAREKVEKNYNDFLMFSFVFSWINTISITCMFGLIQPFIEMWIGKENLLDDSVMILFCIYCYFFNMCTSINPYFDGNGLWEKIKELVIVFTLLNIILNLVLGKMIGVSGIIISTIICLVIPFVIGRVYYLYTLYFIQFKMMEYYRLELINLCVTIASCLVMAIISEYFKFELNVINLLIKFILCMVVSNVLFIIICSKMKVFRQCICFAKLYVLKESRKI